MHPSGRSRKSQGTTAPRCCGATSATAGPARSTRSDWRLGRNKRADQLVRSFLYDMRLNATQIGKRLLHLSNGQVFRIFSASSSNEPSIYLARKRLLPQLEH